MTLNINIENVSAIKRKVTVQVPAEIVANALQAGMAKVQQKATLDGFRAGKVPKPMLEKHFGDAIARESLDSVLDATFTDAVTKSELTPLGQPEITPTGLPTAGETFTYALTFEIRPTVSVQQYKKLALTQTVAEVTDADVDAQLKQYQESMTQVEAAPEGTVAAAGMLARLDFEGTADGKSFEGSSGKDVIVDIGSGALLKAFEAELVGMTVGETKTMSFSYPADYFNVTLAGSTATYTVTCKELRKKIIPELNDEFAKDLGSYHTLADVKKEIREKLTELRAGEAKQALEQHAMQALVEANPVEVPQTMIGWELSHLYQQFEDRLKRERMTWEQSGMTPDQFVQQYSTVARDRVAGYLLLDAIATSESIAATDDELSARILTMAKNSTEEAERLRRLYEERNLLGALKTEILHQKCLDFVLSQATIKSEVGSPK